MSRVLIAGYYGFGNSGDEAILSSMVSRLRRLRPELDVVVVSGNPSQTSKDHVVRAVSWNDVEGVIAVGNQSDLVVLGGGGLFQDYWGASLDTVLTASYAGIPFYSSFPLLAFLIDKPCMIYAVGVGPLLTEAGKVLTRLAFASTNIATVRDPESKFMLESVGVPPERIQVTADPAFDLEFPDSIRILKVVQEVMGTRFGRPLVGVALRNWNVGVSQDSWEHQVAVGLDRFVAELNAAVLFVPFQEVEGAVTNDVDVANRVRNQMRHSASTVVLKGDLSAAQRGGVLGCCDIVLGMRLHSVAFAAKGGVPVVALAYDPKVSNLMRRLDCEDYVLELPSLDSARLAEVLAKAYADRGNLSPPLRDRADQFAQLARQNADLAITLLDSSEPARAPLSPELIGSVKELAVRQTRELARRTRQAAGLENRLEEQAGFLHSTQVESADKEQAVRTLQKQIRELAEKLRNVETRFDAYFRDKELYIAALKEELRWAKWLGFYGLLTLLQVFVAMAARSIKAVVRKLLPSVGAFWDELKHKGHPEQDLSEVTVYYAKTNLFPQYTSAVSMSSSGTNRTRASVSLVVTAKNERHTVGAWLDTLLHQTRLPDEFIAVDGGSSDGTLEVLREFARAAPFKVEVIAAGDVNIAQGKNVGIAKATHSVIANTDLGCTLDPAWLEYLTRPFEINEKIEVVAGWYEPWPQASFARVAAQELVPTLGQIDPQSFLPSARSVAFKKNAWEAIGGYPEWLSSTGEDTYFGLELKRCCRKWAFVPEAKVYWAGPTTLRGSIVKAYRWSIGDGEAGVFPERYRSLLLNLFRTGTLVMIAAAALVLSPFVKWLLVVPAVTALLVSALILRLAGKRGALDKGKSRIQTLGMLARWGLTFFLIQSARALGFLKGVLNRPRVRVRRFAKISGTTFILSGVPISDSGGGQRAAQLASAFLHRNNLVVFISKFPTYESKDLKIPHMHPNLLTFTADSFRAGRFLRGYSSILLPGSVIAIVEFPLADFLPMVKSIRRAGGVVVYDLIDDWTTSLGGTWYSSDVERAIVNASDVLVATSERLKKRLEQIATRPVALLPNAVNLDLFDRYGHYERPVDLPQGGFVICYVGALWGEWFNWTLLRQVALAYPKASVIVIGDYRNQCPDPPVNLHFLGLKPQAEIPAYLAHSHVGIIPWTASKITHATSPLKVYEYLAMGKPIVAPNLEALNGIPYIFLANDDAEFIKTIDEARETVVDGSLIADFLKQNSWTQRVEALVNMCRQAIGKRIPQEVA